MALASSFYVLISGAIFLRCLVVWFVGSLGSLSGLLRAMGGSSSVATFFERLFSLATPVDGGPWWRESAYLYRHGWENDATGAPLMSPVLLSFLDVIVGVFGDNGCAAFFLVVECVTLVLVSRLFRLQCADSLDRDGPLLAVGRGSLVAFAVGYLFNPLFVFLPVVQSLLSLTHAGLALAATLVLALSVPPPPPTPAIDSGANRTPSSPSTGGSPPRTPEPPPPLVQRKRTLSALVVLWVLVALACAFHLPAIAFASVLLGIRPPGGSRTMALYVVHGLGLFGVLVVLVVERFAGRVDFGAVTLVPNAGVQWYMFQLIVPRFEPVFRAALLLVPLMLAVPLVLKFQHLLRQRGHACDGTLVALVVVNLLMVIEKPFLTLQDVAFALVLCCVVAPRIAYETPYAFATAVVYVVTVPLLHAYYYAWLVAGVANANFFFFTTVAFCAGNVVFAVQYATRHVVAAREHDEAVRVAETYVAAITHDHQE